jgi:ParB-like chromosome segregation protein Spo0J
VSNHGSRAAVRPPPALDVLRRLDPAAARAAILLIVPVERIDAPAWTARDRQDASDMDLLTRDIWSYGLVVPLLARPELGGRYRIVGDERLFEAARRAGLANLRLQVVAIDDPIADRVRRYADGSGLDGKLDDPKN